MAMRNNKIWSAVLVVFTALVLGDLSSIAWASSQQQPTPAVSKLMANYEDVDLHEFINQMAAYLGLTPMIIDPDVKGKVTLRMSSPMPKEDVLPLFHAILKNNKAALIKQDDVYGVVPMAAPVR
jgi:type II secretory pathway component GspD/PulD (secretin)